MTDPTSRVEWTKSSSGSGILSQKIDKSRPTQLCGQVPYSPCRYAVSTVLLKKLTLIVDIQLTQLLFSFSSCNGYISVHDESFRCFFVSYYPACTPHCVANDGSPQCQFYMSAYESEYMTESFLPIFLHSSTPSLRAVQPILTALLCLSISFVS